MEGKRPEIPSELQSAINIALFQAQQTYMAAAATELTDFKNEFRREMLEFMAQIRETVRGIYAVDPEPTEQQQRQTPAVSTMDSAPSTPQQPQMPTESSVAGVTQVAPDLTSNVDQSETPKPRKIQEPALPIASPTLEAPQDYINDVEASRDPEAKQSASANDPNPELVEEHDQSPRPRTSEHSASCSNPSKDPERKAHQWLWVPVLRDSHVQVDGGNKDWLNLHLRIKKLVNRRNQRHCRRQEVRTPKTKFGQVQGADDPRLVEYSGTDPVVEALHRPRAGGGEKDQSACRNFTEDTHPAQEFESPMLIFDVADSPSEIGTQTAKSDPMASIWNKRIIARLTQSIKVIRRSWRQAVNLAATNCRQSTIGQAITQEGATRGAIGHRLWVATRFL
ncbi:hypothetical protein ACLKA6_013739 [Drosophila palustris]